MYRIILTLTLIFSLPLLTFSQENKSFYDFVVNDIDGNLFDLAQLKGKKVMVVNVASKCGLTPQYEQLQELYEEFEDDNFAIIGFPANNFLSQEPGSEKEIKSFCTENYGVTFPMMSKISVKGEDMHPLYQWLTTKKLNGFEDSSVKWNFQKYLINRDGTIAKVISPKTKPYDDEIINWIKN
nr:glutathione peroxidase [uncultured Carboxylicivirga sp.]